MHNVESKKHSDRLQNAYLKERERQSLMEVELSKTMVIVVDANGKFIKVMSNNEH
ncbi:hypothetical protein R3X26_03365 [Vibrio sp. TH_r3]|uniref:hypothetical protein n=1 Tax=Vibrio sp. TH_r3 TaxID=3082084 RepID=UPI0029536443|nr:hypothetical protein [Vibrio sp. TH_r3]MDV7103441.1 hypothetical protein [Vibrio sp. TH_r3]